MPKAPWNDFDGKLNFNIHNKDKVGKANNGIGIIRKLAHVLPRDSLVTICKSFIRPHIDFVISYITDQIMNLFVLD